MNDSHTIPEDMPTPGPTEGHEIRAGVETPRPTPGASSFDREEIKPLSASLNLPAIIADFKGAARALVRLQDRESADRKLREMEHESVREEERRKLRELVTKSSRPFRAVEIIAAQVGVPSAELVLQADEAAGGQVDLEHWARALRATDAWYPRAKSTGRRPTGTYVSRTRWGW